MTELISRRFLDFLLFEALAVQERCEPGGAFAEHDLDTFAGVLDLAGQLADECFEPLAAPMDDHEPRIGEDGRVVLPEGSREALQAFVESGFLVAGVPAEAGGLGLPTTVHQAAMALLTAANAGLMAYPFLSVANANLLRTFGTDDQRRRYLASLEAGRFTGTMCLSEPQAGSSLADVRTTATPAGGGSYRLRGTKMWISGGEHELSENIIHLVLARIDGAPSGVRGLSLFLVPRYRVDESGEPGAPNDVTLAGLNHKMGYRGTVNCVLNFGDADACLGELVGPPNEGLRCMFHMMNEARIGVGLGAAAMGSAAFRHSLAYAIERPQGRPLGDRDPDSPPVPISEHADVKRMLLKQKAYAEGGLALCLYAADLVDRMLLADDEVTRQGLERRLDLLTPIVKAWPAEFCLEANKEAIQILGGYGYTRDYPVERIYRDNRLNPIHEGTNGIQGIDLMGRKVLGDAAAALREFLAEMRADADAIGPGSELANAARQLTTLLEVVMATVGDVGQHAAAGRLEEALADSTDFLEGTGHLVVGWLWLRLAARAEALVPEAGDNEHRFLAGMIAACRYFYRHAMPEARLRLERVGAGGAVHTDCDPASL
ncbi:MAG: acyl-CoA dehydrogenase [Pseudomonadota bacterium]